MSARETVETFITALQSGDLELAASTMTDDFTLRGLAAVALDRNELLAMQSELLTAMPDFSYNLADLHTEGDRVRSTITITGTQTNDLSLPRFGLPSVQATGLAIRLPQSTAEYLVREGRVARMQVEKLPGGGLNGLIQQLGAELPVLPRQEISEISSGE